MKNLKIIRDLYLFVIKIQNIHFLYLSFNNLRFTPKFVYLVAYIFYALAFPTEWFILWPVGFSLELSLSRECVATFLIIIPDYFLICSLGIIDFLLVLDPSFYGIFYYL